MATPLYRRESRGACWWIFLPPAIVVYQVAVQHGQTRMGGLSISLDRGLWGLAGICSVQNLDDIHGDAGRMDGSAAGEPAVFQSGRRGESRGMAALAG